MFNNLITNISSGIIQQGSLLNLPDWALMHYFAIPESEVVLLVGDEVGIYGDSLIVVANNNNLHV